MCVGADNLGPCGGRAILGAQHDEAGPAHQPRVELGDSHLLRCPRELPQEVLEEGLRRKLTTRVNLRYYTSDVYARCCTASVVIH